LYTNSSIYSSGDGSKIMLQNQIVKTQKVLTFIRRYLSCE